MKREVRGWHGCEVPAPLPGRVVFLSAIRWLTPPAKFRSALRAWIAALSVRLFLRDGITRRGGASLANRVAALACGARLAARALAAFGRETLDNIVGDRDETRRRQNSSRCEEPRKVGLTQPGRPRGDEGAKTSRPYKALRNSVGVTPTTRRNTWAKWLGLA